MGSAGRAFVLRTGAFGAQGPQPASWPPTAALLSHPRLGHLSACPKDKGSQPASWPPTAALLSHPRLGHLSACPQDKGASRPCNNLSEQGYKEGETGAEGAIDADAPLHGVEGVARVVTRAGGGGEGERRRVYTHCSSCEAQVPAGHMFCGRCGARMVTSQELGRKTQPISTLTTPGKARLMLVEGGSGMLPGMSFHLNAQRHPVGREQGVILLDDPWVSPAHGEISYGEDGALYVEDDQSANGTFARVREPVMLVAGDRFLIGRQLFQFDPIDPDAALLDPDGTRAYGSPRKHMRMRVLHLLEGGRPGRAWAIQAQELTFGREGCVIDLSHDARASRKHARISARGDAFLLEDLGSTNGTFVKARGRARLRHGDDLIIGQHRLRVEINP
jgi:pSer/pThr/pTyr-binding forkhead associated (FHA) protein